MHLGERIDVRIEVEDDAIILVLPRRLDDLMIPYQEAFQLGETMELAASDVPNVPIVFDPLAVQRESAQVNLTKHKDLVVLLFDHADRVRLSPEAAKIVARAIKQVAQDITLALRDIHLIYNRRGQIKRLVNQKLGYTQHVR